MTNYKPSTAACTLNAVFRQCQSQRQRGINIITTLCTIASVASRPYSGNGLSSNTTKVTGEHQRRGRAYQPAERARGSAGAHSAFGAASSGGVKNCHCGVSRAALQRSNSMPESGDTPSGGAQPHAGARSGVPRAVPEPSALLTPESGGTGSTPSSSSTCHETA